MEAEPCSSPVRGRIMFYMQIGLLREPVYIETDLTIAVLHELACDFVDRKVSYENELCLLVLWFSWYFLIYFKCCFKISVKSCPLFETQLAILLWWVEFTSILCSFCEYSDSLVASVTFSRRLFPPLICENGSLNVKITVICKHHIFMISGMSFVYFSFRWNIVSDWEYIRCCMHH